MNYSITEKIASLTNNQASIEDDLVSPVFNHSMTNRLVESIFSQLNQASAEACVLVNKDWRKQVLHSRSGNILCHQLAIGPHEWAKFLRAPMPSDEEIQLAYSKLPDNIDEILQSSCPIDAGKLVKDTHLLVYIQRCVNDLLITLPLLGKLQEPYSSAPVGSFYSKYCELIRKLNNPLELDKPVEHSHWVLMAKEVLPEEKNNLQWEEFDAYQFRLVQELAQSSGGDYVLPRTIEAVAAIVAYFLKTGERLFANKAIRSIETFKYEDEAIYSVAIGCFGDRGVRVSRSGDFGHLFLAPLRRYGEL